MALTSLEMYYSFPNIQIITLKYCLMMEKHGWTFIYRPVVTRSKQSTMNCNVKSWKKRDREDEKRIIWSPNPSTLCCVLQILNVDGSLCEVLGFNKMIYKAGRHKSENLVNILSVNSILVHCDVIAASRLNGIDAPLIYSFFPDVGPGDKIVSIPLHLIYSPLTLNIISLIMCWLTDQNGRELELQGEEVTITFMSNRAETDVYIYESNSFRWSSW